MSGTITLISATNLHLAEGDEGIVPQIRVFTEGCVDYFLFKTKYRVLHRKKVTEITWNMSVPFQFFRATKFRFMLYHKKLIAANVLIGTCEMDLANDPLAVPFHMKVKSETEEIKTPAVITAQVDYEFPPYPSKPLRGTFDLLYVYLTYDPIVVDQMSVDFECLFFDLRQQFYTIVSSDSDPSIIGKSGHRKWFAGPTGFTPIMRLNVHKLEESLLTFLVSSPTYKGEVTLCFVGVAKELKSDGVYTVEHDTPAAVHSVKVRLTPGVKVSVAEYLRYVGNQWGTFPMRQAKLEDPRMVGRFENEIMSQLTTKRHWRRIMASIGTPLSLDESSLIQGLNDLSQLAVIWGWNRRTANPEERDNGKMNIFLHVYDSSLHLIDSIHPKLLLDKKKALHGLIRRHKKNPYTMFKCPEGMEIKYKDRTNVLIDLRRLMLVQGVYALVIGVTASNPLDPNINHFEKTFVRAVDPVTKRELMFHQYHVHDPKAEGFVIGAFVFDEDVWKFFTISAPFHGRTNADAKVASLQEISALSEKRTSQERGISHAASAVCIPPIAQIMPVPSNSASARVVPTYRVMNQPTMVPPPAVVAPGASPGSPYDDLPPPPPQ